jgi:hypothetical protein
LIKYTAIKNKYKKMENKKTIEAIVDFIVTAEKSIKNAKKLLKDLADSNDVDLKSEVDLSTK